ncbi:hypothetical protein NLX83_39600 [Allokutzneria sp. A3M-2-11 16]|uniref:hypothetical protein n=1 Tax=Allokutzneria sp. A3M-2-11 16 TaxID=2962043 RepID=UPI0020B8458A|nr:hypothetical protein [Allokutzneria sp. A3M-2-11 16]MCP3805390.1 hypothetical protein [Allokutzneria sp. A3M-2-11 16]
MSKLIDKLTEIMTMTTDPLQSRPIYLTPDQFLEVMRRKGKADPFDESDPWSCYSGQVCPGPGVQLIVVENPEESTPYLEGWEL